MIGLITSRLAGPVASIVAILFLALAMSQCSARVKAEHALGKANQVAADAQRDLKTCKGNVVELQSALGRQNWAVDGLKREAEARVAESRKAVSAARAVAASYRREAAEILKAKPGSDDRCVAARKLIEEHAG